MRLICPNCDAHYDVDASAIPISGREVQCSACGEAWFQLLPDDDGDDAAEQALIAATQFPRAHLERDAAAPTGIGGRPLPQFSPEDPDPDGLDSEPPFEESLLSLEGGRMPSATHGLHSSIDDDLLAVLREEAKRELDARRLESGAVVDGAVSEEKPSPPAAAPIEDTELPSAEAVDDFFSASAAAPADFEGAYVADDLANETLLNASAAAFVNVEAAETPAVSTAPDEMAWAHYVGAEPATTPEPEPATEAPEASYLDLSAPPAGLAGAQGHAPNGTLERGLRAAPRTTHHSGWLDVDGISETLTSSDPNFMDEVLPPSRKSGFLRGFLLALIVAIVLFAIYLWSPLIIERLPQVADLMKLYVEVVDALRLALADLSQMIRETVNRWLA